MTNIDWKWYGAGSLVSFAGFVTILSHQSQSWWGDTEPFWNTDYSGLDSIMLPVASVLLTFAFAMSASSHYQKQVNNDNEVRSIDKIPYYLYFGALACIAVGALVAALNTVDMKPVDDATLSGARAFQCMVFFRFTITHVCDLSCES